MEILINFNEHNLRQNKKNIIDFNYLSFTENQWESIGQKLSKRFPRKYNKTPYKLVFEATKINPIVKMFFASKKGIEEKYVCIKLTPFEVMVGKDSEEEFKYNKLLTHVWQDILQQNFGENYIEAKNKHYGIHNF